MGKPRGSLFRHRLTQNNGKYAGAAAAVHVNRLLQQIHVVTLKLYGRL
jgi:hypothetical protein